MYNDQNGNMCVTIKMKINCIKSIFSKQICKCSIKVYFAAETGFKKNCASRTTQPKMGTIKQCHGKMKYTGVILTPTTCCSVYENMLAIIICPIRLMAWNGSLTSLMKNGSCDSSVVSTLACRLDNHRFLSPLRLI